MSDQSPFRSPVGAQLNSSHPGVPSGITQTLSSFSSGPVSLNAPPSLVPSNSSSNIFGAPSFMKSKEVSSNATDTSIVFGVASGVGGSSGSFGNPSSTATHVFGQPAPSEAASKSNVFVSSGFNALPRASKSIVFGSPPQPLTGGRPSIFGGSSSNANIFGGVRNDDPPPSTNNFFGDISKPSEPLNASTVIQNLTTNPLTSGAKLLFGQQTLNVSEQASGSSSNKLTFGLLEDTPMQDSCSSTSLTKQESSYDQRPPVFGGSSHSNVFRVPSVPVSQSLSTLPRIGISSQDDSSAIDNSKSPVYCVESKSGNTVSSTMPYHFLRSRTIKNYAEDRGNDSRLQSRSEKLAEDQDRDWEPDSVGEEDQEVKHLGGKRKLKASPRSTKFVHKQGVFAKALHDVSKSSEKESTSEEELKSVYCRPIDGSLPEKDTLKAHFSQFGAIHRIFLNPQNQYCTVTYRTHDGASKAIKECHQIGETKVQLFWRNVSKLKRRAEEELTIKSNLMDPSNKRSREASKDLPDVREELEGMKSKELEHILTSRNSATKKKTVRKDVESMELDIDSEVRDELEALSQLDYQSHDPRPGTEGEQIKRSTKVLKSRLGRTAKERKSIEKSHDPNKMKKTRIKKIGKTNDLGSSSETTGKEASDGVIPGSSSVGSTTGAAELLALMKTPAFTSEEKLKVLDARDKLIRLRLVKQCDLSKAVKTVGTCPDMCPEKERLLRETRRQVSQYEMSSSKMEPALMVKQYSRSSADQEEPLPHELRPPNVLTMTMNYLLHNIMDLCDKPGENLADWYHFLWDRTRGIRKEITQQELCDVESVSLVEQCARFHIHCCARLVAEDMSVFDDRINTENLTKCLQTLKHMYHDLWIKSSITCPNEPEFITYFLLLNLNNGTIMWEIEQLREEVLTSSEIAFAVSLYRSLSSNNFVRFFRLVQKASYLNSCLCIRYFYQMRSRALRTYVKALAFRPIQYPLSSLVHALGFETIERAAAFCMHHGLQVDENLHEESFVVLSASSFDIPDNILPRERAFQLVESKKKSLVGEVVYGGSLPPRSFEHHIPHNSFDSNGLLHTRAHSAKDQGVISGDKEVDLFIEESVGDIVQSVQLPLVAEKSHQQESMISTAGSQSLVTRPLQSKLSSPSMAFSSQISLPKSTSNVVIPPAPSSLGDSTQGHLKGLESTSFIRTVGSVILSNNYTSGASSRLSQTDVKEIPAKTDKTGVEALEEAIMVASQQHEEDILRTVVLQELEVLAKSVLEDARAEEKAAKELALRERLLHGHIERVSNELIHELLEELIPHIVLELASEAEQEERALCESIEHDAETLLNTLISIVVEDDCRTAAREARENALQCLVRDCFYHWLLCARRSLRMKHAMEDFPAGVLPLSIQEHAQRWGVPDENQLKVWKGRYGRHEKALGLPDLKSSSSFIHTTLADLIGVQVLHRYEFVRPKLGLRTTDYLLFKLLVSVPNQSDDPSSYLVEWWIRRAFKLNNCMLYDDPRMGILRLISGQKVTPEMSVYTSLQMVKGEEPLKKRPSLVSGTSAVLFGVSPSSSIEDSQLRLRLLLQGMAKLPPVPLVIVVVSLSEPPIEGLKQLVVELQLDYWLMQNIISGYQILYVEERADVERLTHCIKPALNYLTMTWTPTPQVDFAFLKNILLSTFRMFYISIQFNYNSSELYPQDVDDPRVIIGLCNEWLDLMCNEFIFSLHEARDIYGEEFWPLLQKGAFLPFYTNPQYEQHLKEVIMSIKLPEIQQWPPSCQSAFDCWFSSYSAWLKPDDLKLALKRLSCLSHLSFSEKLKSISWIHLVEGWMEARIRDAVTTGLHSSELMCVMRSQKVEELYTHAWWAHSKHICTYLDSHKSGSESVMDLDQSDQGSFFIGQTTESESSVNNTELKEPTAVNQLKEVSKCITELKNLKESLTCRLKQALHQSNESGKEALICCAVPNASCINHTTKEETPSDVSSVLKSIDSQIQIEHNVHSNVNFLLSTALATDSEWPVLLAEDNKSDTCRNVSLPQEALNECKKKEDIESVKNDDDPSKKMADIMKSANRILSSLEKKHNISSKKQSMDRLTGLKIGTEKSVPRVAPLASEILQRSAFVEQSEKRREERVMKIHCVDDSTKVDGKRKRRQNSDSDLEVLSGDDESVSSYSKSVSSPLYQDSDDYEDVNDDSSPSDVTPGNEDEEAQILSSDSSMSCHELHNQESVNMNHDSHSLSMKGNKVCLPNENSNVRNQHHSDNLFIPDKSVGKNEHELEELDMEEEQEEEVEEEAIEEEEIEEEEDHEEDEEEAHIFSVNEEGQSSDQENRSSFSYENRFRESSENDLEVMQESVENDGEEVSYNGGRKKYPSQHSGMDSQSNKDEVSDSVRDELYTSSSHLVKEDSDEHSSLGCAEDEKQEETSYSNSDSQSDPEDAYSSDIGSQEDDRPEDDLGNSDYDSETGPGSDSDDCKVIED